MDDFFKLTLPLTLIRENDVRTYFFVHSHHTIIIIICLCAIRMCRMFCCCRDSQKRRFYRQAQRNHGRFVCRGVARLFSFYSAVTLYIYILKNIIGLSRRSVCSVYYVHILYVNIYVRRWVKKNVNICLRSVWHVPCVRS